MDASAEQLVLDYLRRLGDAAHRLLRPDERLTLMMRVRAAIAEQIAESRADAAGDVLRLLGRFGDPEELAARERQRLDAAAPAGSGPPGTPDTPRRQHPGALPPGRRPFAAPSLHRPMTARLRPGDGLAAAPRQRRRRTRPLSGTGPAPPDPAAQPGPAVHPGPAAQPGPAASPDRPTRDRQTLDHAALDHTARDRPPQDGPAPIPPRPGGVPGSLGPSAPGSSGPSAPASPRPDPPDSPGPSATASPRPEPPDSPGPSAPATDRTAPDALPPSPSGDRDGASTPPGAAPGTTGNQWGTVLALVRRHPLETAAVLLLGLGGLIYPFPLWLLGAVAVIASRLWDARDKWTALAVPVVFALIGAIAIAGLTARSGSLAGYARTVRIDGWDLIRAGSVAGAAYLAWRVRQGRRPGREPPWRRTPHR